jgi:hypothetical protein
MGTKKRWKHPDAELMHMIANAAVAGLTEDQISTTFQLSLRDLHRHYQATMEEGRGQSIYKVAKSLYQMATDEKNVTAMIFYLKCRAGWKEARPDPLQLEHSGPAGGPIETKDQSPAPSLNTDQTKEMLRVLVETGAIESLRKEISETKETEDATGGDKPGAN